MGLPYEDCHYSYGKILIYSIFIMCYEQEHIHKENSI